MIGHNASLAATQSHPAINNVRNLLEDLAEQFRLIVIDLNYDDIVDDAKIRWEDGFSIPVTDGSLFDPRDCSRVVANGSHLLIHLHGSVRFGQIPPGTRWIGGPEEPAKYPSFAIARTHRSASGSHAVVDGRSYSAPYIISGAAKGAKFVYNLRPYGFYTAALTMLAPLVTGVLTIGYGWADSHVNTLIRDLVATSPSLPKAILTRRCGADVGEYTHLDTERWYRRIAHAEINPIDGFATLEERHVDRPTLLHIGKLNVAAVRASICRDGAQRYPRALLRSHL